MADELPLCATEIFSISISIIFSSIFQEILLSNLFPSGSLSVILLCVLSAFIVFCSTLSYLCALSTSIFRFYHCVLHRTIQPTGCKRCNKRLTYLFTYLLKCTLIKLSTNCDIWTINMKEIQVLCSVVSDKHM